MKTGWAASRASRNEREAGFAPTDERGADLRRDGRTLRNCSPNRTCITVLRPLKPLTMRAKMFEGRVASVVSTSTGRSAGSEKTVRPCETI